LHEADALPQFREIRFAEFFAEDMAFPFAGPPMRGGDARQRAFPAAVGAEDGCECPNIHRPIDVSQNPAPIAQNTDAAHLDGGLLLIGFMAITLFQV
jgi:hypothetical protein